MVTVSCINPLCTSERQKC